MNRRTPIIREATRADIPALAELHVRRWRETYEAIAGHPLPDAPTYALREAQWRKAFDDPDSGVFVFLVEDDDRVVGFASGRPFDSAEFPGELSKIYLDEAYMRRGLGRRLFGHVARRFLERGIGAMTLYADGRNPACRFFEWLGGERVNDASEGDAWYGWRDLEALAAACPIEPEVA